MDRQTLRKGHPRRGTWRPEGERGVFGEPKEDGVSRIESSRVSVQLRLKNKKSVLNCVSNLVMAKSLVP